MADRPVLRFEGDLVLKWYPSNVGGEFVKARSLWEVSQEGGFLCPEPIALDEDESVITYRNLRVHGDWVSVRTPYLDFVTGATPSDGSAAAIGEAGRVLGAIHRDLEVKGSERWDPPAEFRDSLARAGVNGDTVAPEVYLHGDYGFSNVLWSHEMGKIATLDPSPDGYSTFVAGLRGPAYVDLGQFDSCLEGRVPLWFYPRIKWGRLDELREAFLNAYEKESRSIVDREVVRRFGFAIAEANFQDRLGSKTGRRLASKVLYNRLKGNAL